MDMLDPNLTPEKEVQTPEVTEAAAEAPATPAESAAEPQPEAEVEAEEIMTEGEDLAEAEAADTPETVLEAAEAMLVLDGSAFGADDIRRLRQRFSMLHKPESTSAEVPEEGAAEEKAPEIDPVAARFTEVIEQLRAKKAEWTAAEEARRAANLERKNAIIAEIIALAEDTDNVNRTFPRYRELQDEFNSIGDVDPTEDTAVWKRFQEARERYSDNLKINKELRDYDFKKNLADKELLLAEARGLAAEEDVIAAYRRLQDLHNKWRQIGPVAKELRDEIWNNFRDASAEVNKRYQAFFEARKAREAENEAAKTALCERLEALDYSSLKTFASWEEMTRSVIGLQEEWRTLGYASKKMNRSLFARFRKGCDAFFAAKADFYRNTREELSVNLAHKQRLVEEAEALKESSDWGTATNRFVEMQKEWKTIGAIPKKYSEGLWKRFTEACDCFFDRKKKANSGTRQAEAANLKTKREIIGMLEALMAEGVAKDEAIAKLKDLQKRWQETGHVPFREKDKLYEAYRSACDAVRDHFAIAESRARRDRFEASVQQLEGDADKLYRERERLTRALEGRRGELRTYENNLGFLQSKSKSGDSLLRDMSRRIDRLKADIEEIREKIRLVDEKIKQ